MRPIYSLALDSRLVCLQVDEDGGAFRARHNGRSLLIVASDGMGWDHVSVSLANRCPTWEEMEYVKHIFFREGETAMQLHVPVSDHINCHPYCLHLWRPQNAEIPRPPAIMVGLPTAKP